ncbi:helix-turn-helix domain-containing protein [Companilactobacillus nodensis]|uniref:IS putative transposase n=1 Tax=Companilactobacillus nodensis DSM 19682 = JCM 14932 = NBRC 107160 TaxID=1423775 RepID=A0A0R1KE90_9LACO|nr:transposase [Companilactobacillus nodensis]KRK79076.1 IS putative transposase [Companilactobacillus nodensis DSM 19682 = JCM 14932 = NBRC 107160]
MFSKDVKLKAINDLNAGIKVKQVMDKYGIKGTATLYQWKYAHDKFGDDGLIPFRNGRTIHDYSFKIKVIRWRIDNIKSYPDAAKHFDITAPATVWYWENDLLSGRLKPKFGRSDTNMSKEDQAKKLKDLEEENKHLKVKVAYLEKLKALTQKNKKSQTNKRPK